MKTSTVPPPANAARFDLNAFLRHFIESALAQSGPSVAGMRATDQL